MTIKYKIISFAVFVLLCIANTAKGDNYIHLIMYGQSLSEGYQSYPPLSVIPCDNNFMIGNQVWINRGNTSFSELTPLKASVSLYDVVNGYKKTRANGVKCENPIIGTANHIRNALPQYDPIIATSCGSDGKTIEQLSKEATHTEYLYGDFIKTIKSTSEIIKSGNHTIFCPAIFWMQGEYNYKERIGLTPNSKSTTDKDKYKELLLILKNNMQNDIANLYAQQKPLFITYQTSGQKWCNTFEGGISMAQLEATNEYDDIICAGPVYPVTDRGGHLDPNGYRWYGEMLGKVFFKTVILGEDFKPLQPISIRKTDARTLEIKFHVPVEPLCFELKHQAPVKDFGFVVKDKTGRKTISQVSIEGTSKVKISLDTDMDGYVEIGYAGKDTNGHGNLRDSDNAIAYSVYEDLDKKDDSGNFIYPREQSETTLRPEYEPIDGRDTYYGKPYPLHNYCVMFYYKLNEDEDTLNIKGFETSGITDVISSPDIKISDSGNGIIKICEVTEVSTTVSDLSGTIYRTGYVNEIDMKTLPKGVYIIRAVSKNGNSTLKYFNN